MENRIKFSCTGCDQRYEVQAKAAGKIVKCSKCNSKMRVPIPTSEVSQIPEAVIVAEQNPTENASANMALIDATHDKSVFAAEKSYRSKKELWLAILFWLFLGGVGIHRLYIEDYKFFCAWLAVFIFNAALSTIFLLNSFSTGLLILSAPLGVALIADICFMINQWENL